MGLPTKPKEINENKYIHNSKHHLKLKKKNVGYFGKNT